MKPRMNIRTLRWTPALILMLIAFPTGTRAAWNLVISPETDLPADTRDFGDFALVDSARRLGTPLVAPAGHALYLVSNDADLSGHRFLFEGARMSIVIESLGASPPSARSERLDLPLHRPHLARPKRAVTQIPVDAEVKWQLVDRASQSLFEQRVRELSGELSFELDGVTQTVDDRNTCRDEHLLAALYLEDRFEALGWLVSRQAFDMTGGTFCPGTGTRNIVAKRPGTTLADEIIVVGAHYDSIAIDGDRGPAPGAEDNASGTAALLVLAEIFRHYEMKRTVHLVAFGGEEQGLLGSFRYVQQAAANGWNINGAIILDMVSAHGPNYRIDIEGEDNIPAAADLAAFMQIMDDNVNDASPNLGTVQTFNSFGSDHVPFQMSNIPAFLLIESDWASYAPYHTVGDTFDKLDTTLGLDVIRAVASTLAETTGPTPRSVPVLAQGFEARAIDRTVRLRWRAIADARFFVTREFSGSAPHEITPRAIVSDTGNFELFDSEVPAHVSRASYQLWAEQGDGTRSALEPRIEVTLPVLPTARLHAPRPNPFNPTTLLSFDIAQTQQVELAIFDASGRLVRQLWDHQTPAGRHSVTWNGKDDRGQRVASGAYTARLVHGEGQLTQKLVLVE